MARELGSGRYFNSGMGKHRQETKDDGNRFNEYMTDKKRSGVHAYGNNIMAIYEEWTNMTNTKQRDRRPQRLSEGNYTRPVLKFDLTPVERT